MPVTAKFLKDIMAEAKPVIKRQLNDATIVSGFQKVVSAAGGDWGALKALIKAHIEDEMDETGDGNRVQKILDKADSSTAYADMLGLAKMNENNFSAEMPKATSYAEAKGVDREARAKQRMSESMDDHKAMAAELVAVGLISEEAHAEHVRLSDAIARKYGAGVIDPETGEVTDETNSPETATISGADYATSPKASYDRHDADKSPVTNSHSLPTSSPVADTADSVTPPALSAPITAGPQSTAVPGGEPSTPSIDDGGAKMGEVPASPDRSDEQSVIHHAQSKQAAPNSDDVPAFLKSKEGCLRPGDCRTHFTSVLCSGCANERAKRLVNA